MVQGLLNRLLIDYAGDLIRLDIKTKCVPALSFAISSPNHTADWQTCQLKVSLWLAFLTLSIFPARRTRNAHSSPEIAKRYFSRTGGRTHHRGSIAFWRGPAEPAERHKDGVMKK